MSKTNIKNHARRSSAMPMLKDDRPNDDTVKVGPEDFDLPPQAKVPGNEINGSFDFSEMSINEDPKTKARVLEGSKG